MMEIDIALAEHAAEAEAKVWEAAGGYAPTIGIIGAVMGLIQVMKHLEDIKEVGHGIAVAFVATVYGVGSANIFFLPAASKLRTRMHEASLRKDMILEGVIGIVEGLNPTLIRMKLDAYNPHPARQARKRAEDRRGAGRPVRGAKRGETPEVTRKKDGRTCEPRTLAGVLCRFHDLAVRFLRGDVRFHANRQEQGQGCLRFGAPGAGTRPVQRGDFHRAGPRKARSAEGAAEQRAHPRNARTRCLRPVRRDASAGSGQIARYAAKGPGFGPEERQTANQAGRARADHQHAREGLLRLRG